MSARIAVAGLLALALLPAAGSASGGAGSLSVSATVVRGAARPPRGAAPRAKAPPGRAAPTPATLPPPGSLQLSASGETRRTPEPR